MLYLSIIPPESRLHDLLVIYRHLLVLLWHGQHTTFSRVAMRG